MILETDAAAHQVRLARGVAQIVVEAAWAGIGPIQNVYRSAAGSPCAAGELRSSQRRLFSGTSSVSRVAPRSTSMAL